MSEMSEMSEPDNLSLWNQVADTDASMTKQVPGGFKATAIDQTYQRKRATALWGPYGSTWGLRNLKWGYVAGQDGLPVEIWLEAEFYYPGGAFEIAVDMPWKKRDDCRKKLQTDCWKKALAYLGFSADVYAGRFDDEKYIETVDEVSKEKAEEIEKAIQSAPDMETLQRYYGAAKHRNLNRYWMTRVIDAYKARLESLEAAKTFG